MSRRVLNDYSDRNFGLVIAYLLPGIVSLWALGHHLPDIQNWFAVGPQCGLSVGSFLFVALSSVGVGLVVSVIRWLTIDWVHHRTGITPPRWNFAALQKNLAAFDGAVQNHYRYYQFYANTVVSLVLVALTVRPAPTLSGMGRVKLLVGIGFTVIVLFLASRDALLKYYARTAAVLDLELENDDDKRLDTSGKESE